MNTPYQEALGATLIDRTVREKIVIVGVQLPGATEESVDASLDELELLVDTAGADVVERLVQRRDAPDHTWYIGKGKVDELKEICLAVDADTVVFDNELSPGQQYNLEKLLGRTAIDRTAVILDIFGQNAHTLEGKAQVELALLRYRLPRLRRGKSANLSQQRGGVGARFGGGETKTEVDRRRIMRRITKLESDLASLAATRDLQRKSRRRSGLAGVAIVGYTNAGKSTLLNRLTDAGVLTENRLFATLDPTTRRLALPGGEPVAALRHRRVRPQSAARAGRGVQGHARGGRAGRLSRARRRRQRARSGGSDRRGSRGPLGDRRRGGAGAAGVQQARSRARATARSWSSDHTGSVGVSAATGEGIELFLRTLADRLRTLTEIVDLLIPYDRGDVLASVHREGEVVSTTEGDDGFRVRARLSDASAGRLADFVVPSA